MTFSFEDRARAFEAKFAYDEEFRFRVTAHRDHLFAQWVATQQKLDDAAAKNLLGAVLAVADGPGHDQRVLTAVRKILAGHGGLKLTDLEAALARCADQAREQRLAAHVDETPTIEIDPRHDLKKQ